MVTVEVDPARVESRLISGDLACPSCSSGVLGGWGFARVRRVVGAAVPLRPRRSRCRGCRATHVLLPVVVLLRRAYLAELIFAALVSAAAGCGHRAIGAGLGVPSATVRGWVRAVTSRADVLRNWFLAVAVTAGVDVSIPKARGSGCGDVLASIEVARSAVVGRFAGPGVGDGAGPVGAVTASAVAVALSGGRLLTPRWPVALEACGATPVASAADGGDDRSSDATV